MIRFKEMLNEVFDKPYPYKKVKEQGRQIWFSFNTTNDRISVEFLKGIGGRKSWWTVDFYDKDGNTKATNKGDEFRVFSTVLEIIKNVIKDEEDNIELLMMVSTKQEGDKETSRSSLYKRMILKYLPKHWSVKIQDDPKQTMFTLKNNKYKEEQS